MPVTTRSQSRQLKARAELAGVIPNEKTPAWASQTAQDLGPLPDPTSKSKLDEVETHQLPAAPTSLTPTIINGIKVPRETCAYRTMGLKGMQIVLQEGPAQFARYRLVPASKLGTPDIHNLRKVKARAKVKAKDKNPDDPEVTGVWAVAFKDNNNEGTSTLIKSPNTQLVIGVTWSDATNTWEMKSVVTKFLKTQASSFLYDVATRSEDKFEEYVATLKEAPQVSMSTAPPTTSTTASGMVSSTAPPPASTINLGRRGSRQLTPIDKEGAPTTTDEWEDLVHELRGDRIAIRDLIEARLHSRDDPTRKRVMTRVINQRNKAYVAMVEELQQYVSGNPALGSLDASLTTSVLDEYPNFPNCAPKTPRPADSGDHSMDEDAPADLS